MINEKGNYTYTFDVGIFFQQACGSYQYQPGCYNKMVSGGSEGESRCSMNDFQKKCGKYQEKMQEMSKDPGNMDLNVMCWYVYIILLIKFFYKVTLQDLLKV